VPRIPENILSSVFYLYPTAEEAENGTNRGACGFFVDVRSEATQQTHRYCVTNIHVAFGGCTFLRLNTQAGGTEVFEVPISAWKSHSNDEIADVALAAFRHPDSSRLDISAIQWEDLAGTAAEWEAHCRNWNVGVGDDVIMVGRFVGHDGKQRNQPLVRFGNIAMMPGEHVLDGRGELVEAYLVEMRSLPGFSGSPVFLYIGPADYRGNGTMSKFYEEHFALLGIDTGHKMLTSEIRDRTTRKLAEVPFYVLQNTGVAIVAPASKIRDVLYEEGFVDERKHTDGERLEAHGEEHASSDVAQDQSELERFEGLTQRLLAVTKDEADEVHRTHDQP
jgi:hypothetical protein